MATHMDTMYLNKGRGPINISSHDHLVREVWYSLFQCIAWFLLLISSIGSALFDRIFGSKVVGITILLYDSTTLRSKIISLILRF